MPREDLPSCSWEGSPGGFLALPNPPSGQEPRANSPICLANPIPEPIPEATVWLKLQLLCATCLSGTPLTQPEVMSVYDVFLCLPHSIPQLHAFMVRTSLSQATSSPKPHLFFQ